MSITTSLESWWGPSPPSRGDKCDRTVLLVLWTEQPFKQASLQDMPVRRLPCLDAAVVTSNQDCCSVINNLLMCVDASALHHEGGEGSGIYPSRTPQRHQALASQPSQEYGIAALRIWTIFMHHQRFLFFRCKAPEKCVLDHGRILKC